MEKCKAYLKTRAVIGQLHIQKAFDQVKSSRDSSKLSLLQVTRNRSLYVVNVSEKNWGAKDILLNDEEE